MSEGQGRPESLRVGVDCSSGADDALVTVVGEVDLSTASILEHGLVEAVGCGARRVLVDVRAMSFCDVAGLNVLLRARSELHAAGSRLGLIGANRSLSIMLRALGLSDAFAAGDPDGELG